MIKWILSKWYRHTPTCNCGWAMKPTQTRFEDSWKCIKKKCKWETYQSSNGRLHWYKNSNSHTCEEKE